MNNLGKGIATAGMWVSCAIAVIFSSDPNMGFVFIAAMCGTFFMWD